MDKPKKNCSNCANKTKDGCKAMTRRIGSNCFAWADIRERIRRIDDMMNYSGGYLLSQNRPLAAEKRRLMKEMNSSKKLFS